MAQLPEWFEEQFTREFAPRFRIRWSDARQEWHIEQKVGRGFAAGTVQVQPRDARQYRARHDDMIRARDGYVLTLAVTPGTTTDCTRCGSPLEVPAYKFAHVSCEGCVRRGFDAWHTVGYMPLNDDLLHYMRKLDPHRGGIERMVAEAKAETAAAEAAAEKALREPQEAAIRERALRLLDIPHTSLTGPQFPGTEFPGTSPT